MKKQSFLNYGYFIVIALLVVMVMPVKAAGQFEIKSCDASMKFVNDYQKQPRDMLVELKITYYLESGDTITGELHFGETKLVSASLFDADNQPIQTFTAEKFPKFKQNKLSWEINGTEGEEIYVRIRFSLNDVIRGTVEQNHVELPWLTNWNCPVYNMSYQLLLPSKNAFKVVESIPEGAAVKNHVVGRAIESFEEEVSGQPYKVAFSPGIAPELKRSKKNTISDDSFFSGLTWLIIGVAVIAFMIWRKIPPFDRIGRPGA